MDILIEFISIFITYLLVVYVGYYVTEVKRLPRWLRFPPFHCRKCLTFWTMMAVSLVIGLSFDIPVYMATGILLAILTALSMHVEQKNKTVKIENYDDFEPHDIPTNDEPVNIEINGDEIIIN